MGCSSRCSTGQGNIGISFGELRCMLSRCCLGPMSEPWLGCKRRPAARGDARRDGDWKNSVANADKAPENPVRGVGMGYRNPTRTPRSQRHSHTQPRATLHHHVRCAVIASPLRASGPPGQYRNAAPLPAIPDGSEITVCSACGAAEARGEPDHEGAA